MTRALLAVLSFAVLVVVSTCRDDESSRFPTAVPGTPPADISAGSGPVPLVGAGNIAVCGQRGAAATALLLDSIPGTVFADGDAAYDKGALTQYNTCYGVTWGRQKARTQPAPGDLDYKTANASGYFGYFGAAAGDPKQGYYSYDAGAWHVVVLNSGSPSLVPPFGTTRPNSQVRNSGTFGVLNLTLGDGSYSWQFVPVAGRTFTDNGTTACHGARPTVSAGPDITTNPGDTVTVSASFSDPDPSDGPWGYTVNWRDGTSSTGSTASQTAPIAATHVYAGAASFRVPVTVTNNGGISRVDTVAVTVVAPPVLVGAGDIADCTRNQDSLTANLMDTIPGTVFADGDNAYPDGSSTVYKNCYKPTLGRVKARTKPVPGNHDYLTSGASGYFNYFGAAAGQL